VTTGLYFLPALYIFTLKHSSMIVVTGAAGFIGSAMVRHLNNQGHTNLILVDDFSRADKHPNLEGKQYKEQIDRSEFPGWLWEQYMFVDFMYHLGARTDTTEQDPFIFEALNLGYSKTIWNLCTEHQIPLVYASSAATYGLGEHGYVDSHAVVSQLEPLNPYGCSKNDFDAWALQQSNTPPQWAGMKFFNVYGPNEYHKGRMASVIFHTCRQIKATGGMKLFRSHRPDVKDGEQSRDFIYVKDVVDMLYFFKEHQPDNGLYNVGTGQARTFYDLAANTFRAMNLDPNISFIDTPEDIRDTYQYFTEADMQKMRKAGYDKKLYSLEDGIRDYVQQYLMEEKIW
jgi:ADP-L-glycero-D-manno-heptose 6-epimerase